MNASKLSHTNTIAGVLFLSGHIVFLIPQRICNRLAKLHQGGSKAMFGGVTLYGHLVPHSIVAKHRRTDYGSFEAIQRLLLLLDPHPLNFFLSEVSQRLCHVQQPREELTQVLHRSQEALHSCNICGSGHVYYCIDFGRVGAQTLVCRYVANKWDVCQPEFDFVGVESDIALSASLEEST